MRRLTVVPARSAIASIFIAPARITIGLPITEQAASHKNEETKIRLGARPAHWKSCARPRSASATPTRPRAKPASRRGPICSRRKIAAATRVTSGSTAMSTAELPAVPSWLPYTCKRCPTTNSTNPITQVMNRSRPRGAGPGSQGQARNRQSPAKPKRRVTMPPVVRSVPDDLVGRVNPRPEKVHQQQNY